MRFPLALSLPLTLAAGLSAQITDPVIGYEISNVEMPFNTQASDAAASLDGKHILQPNGEQDGLLCVVGAFGDDTNGLDSGKAYWARFEEGESSPQWNELPMPPIDVAPDANFGKWVKITDIDTTNQTAEILVATTGTSAGTSGKVYSYEVNYEDPLIPPEVLQELQKGVINPFDSFGQTGALSGDGDRLFVSAPLGQVGANLAGTVSVFDRDNSGLWQPTSEILDPTMGHGAFFGRGIACSLDGDCVAIGAPLDTRPGEQPNSGSVTIWELDPATNQFVKVDEIVAPNAAANANTGGAVGHLDVDPTTGELTVSFASRGADKAFVAVKPPIAAPTFHELPPPPSTVQQANTPLFGNSLAVVDVDQDTTRIAVGAPFGNGDGQLLIYDFDNNTNEVDLRGELDNLSNESGQFYANSTGFLTPNQIVVGSPMPGFANQTGGQVQVIGLDGKHNGQPRFEHVGVPCTAQPIQAATVGGQRPGDTIQLQVHRAEPFKIGAVVFGGGAGGLPLPGGCTTPTGIAFLGDAFLTDANGQARVEFAVPPLSSTVDLEAFAVVLGNGPGLDLSVSDGIKWTLNSH